MKRQFILALTFFLIVLSPRVHADDNEHPTFGTLNSVTEGDIGDLLDYQCAQQGDALHCHFEQNIIMPVKGSRLTCEIKHHSWDEVYSKKADGLWVHASGPEGGCGAVDTSRFVRQNTSKDKINEWNYITQTTYTNEQGFTPYGTAMLECKKIKESGAEQEITYKWPVKSEYFGCLYIKH